MSKGRKILLVIQWIYTIAAPIWAIMYIVNFKPFVSLMCFLFGFCICPLSSKFFEQWKEKTKFNLQLPAVILSAMIMSFSASKSGIPSYSNSEQSTENVIATQTTVETIATESITDSETIIETTATLDLKDTAEITESTIFIQTTKTNTEIITQTEKEEKIIETTPLYDDAFEYYALMIGQLTWEESKKYAKTLSYKIEIQEPTDDDLGNIHLYDNNNNYIYIYTYPIEQIEYLCLVGYHDAITGNEISVSNELHTQKNIEYHIHDKSKESPNSKTNSIADLKKFMFSDL